MPDKPKCKLIGQDGNVFNIIGLVSKALKKSRQSERAKEFVNRAFKSKSYSEILVITDEYVEIQ